MYFRITVTKCLECLDSTVKSKNLAEFRGDENNPHALVGGERERETYCIVFLLIIHEVHEGAEVCCVFHKSLEHSPHQQTSVHCCK